MAIRFLRIVPCILAGVIGLAATPAAGCDVCAIYIATEVAQSRSGVRLGVGQQWSHSTTEVLNGERIPGFGERLDSSITQFVFGYQFTDRLGVQLNLPFIARAYKRLEDGVLTRGDAIGPGDLSLLGHLLAYAHQGSRSVFLVNVYGGLKLPSGNPDLLAEELDEETTAAQVQRLGRGVPRHGGVDHGHGGRGGGIHGHDLALGSGSVDGIVGFTTYWSWDRFFATAALQYAARREGAFAYRYANDLLWVGGPGWYPLLDHRYTLGFQLVLSGETRGKDTQQGVRLGDTALTALYFGPGLRFTSGTQLAAELTADLPVVQNNTGLQTLPTFRLRTGLIWRF